MKRCPYCSSSGEFYFKIYSRTYHRCLQCGLIYLDLNASYEDVVAPYRKGDYDPYSTDQTERGRDNLYDHVLNLIEKKKSVGTILDVGTGWGIFILKARKNGWVVKGVEPSSKPIEFASREKHLDIFHGTLQEYKGNDRFDVITFINVLDHSASPWQEISHAGELLKPGGLIYIRFPNGLLHTRLYRWAQKLSFEQNVVKFLVFHQYSFTPKFIKKLLSDSGFSEIEILNSPPAQGGSNNLFRIQKIASFVRRSIYTSAGIMELFFTGRLNLGTSLEVVAARSSPNTCRARPKSSKLNILFAADVSIEKVIGGAERVLFEQSSRLDQKGHNVHILTRSLTEYEKNPKIIQGAQEWRYKVDLKNALTYLKSTLQNSRDLFESLQNKIGFDVIIFHQPFSALGIIQSALSRKINKVYICHSLSFEEYISRNKNPEQLFTRLLYRVNVMVRRWIEKRVLNRSDTIIVLSKYTKDKVERIHHISSDRISIISGGVDLDRFKPAGDKKEIRQRLKISEGKVVLFTVRNLVPRMGLENLVKVLSKVAKTAPDIFLVVGGDGPLKNKLVEMARGLGIEDFVRFQGFIPEELLPDYYRMADLFILPTRELEGFGLVTLEAMASGLPVLGTPVGGTVEIIGKFNPDFLFKDSTSDSITALILEKFQIIKQNPEQWKAVSQNCRNFVENNYSWEKHVDGLENCF